MKKSKSFSEKIIWKFIKISGEDAFVVSQCEKETKKRIALIGVGVFTIMILTFISFFLAFYRVLNENWVASSLLAFFIGLIYFTLYQFLNHTLSRNVLPREKSDSLLSASRALSIFLRVGFICFLAFIVGQLLMGSTLGNTINEEINAFKSEKIAQIQTNIRDSKNPILNENDKRIIKLVDSQYFFIKRLKILESNPLAWVITGIVILIFLIPLLLKLLVKLDSSYYTLKEQLQRSIIESNYIEFQEDYKSIMSFHMGDIVNSKINRGEGSQTSSSENLIKEFQVGYTGIWDKLSLPFITEFESNYIDPPYNTIRKTTKPTKTEDEFINKYYKT